MSNMTNLDWLVENERDFVIDAVSMEHCCNYCAFDDECDGFDANIPKCVRGNREWLLSPHVDVNGKTGTDMECMGDMPTTRTWYSFDERTPKNHGWILIADDRFATPTKALFTDDCGVDILRNIGHTNKTDADYGSGFDHAYAWTPLPPMPTREQIQTGTDFVVYAGQVAKELYDEAFALLEGCDEPYFSALDAVCEKCMDMMQLASRWQRLNKKEAV